MKTLHLLLTMAAVAMASLTSCTSSKEGQRDQLTAWANTAITAAEMAGQINPKQAALIRKGGALLLDLSSGKDLDIAALSSEAVAYAVETGKLTPEQAAALKAAGSVPLTTASDGSPVNPHLPTPGA